MKVFVVVKKPFYVNWLTPPWHHSMQLRKNERRNLIHLPFIKGTPLIASSTHLLLLLSHKQHINHENMPKRNSQPQDHISSQKAKAEKWLADSWIRNFMMGFRFCFFSCVLIPTYQLLKACSTTTTAGSSVVDSPSFP